MRRHKSSVSVAWILALAVGAAGCTQNVAGPNRAPVASAGPDRQVPLGQPAVLDGSGSWDPDGDRLDYRWQIVHAPASGDPSGALSDADREVAQLRPDAAGVWVVRLTVLDQDSESVPDVVQVRVAGCRLDADCDDGIACTQDRCQAGVCEHAAQDQACDDGVFCNGPERCDPSDGCQPAGTGPCDDGLDCTQDGCDEASQQCRHVTDDAACDDGQWCNGSEVCDPATGCRPGPDVTCDDSVACTIDACDEANDACTPIAADGACTDGLACNGSERCDPILGCQAGLAPDCDDSFA
jgi:hypothetical protein